MPAPSKVCIRCKQDCSDRPRVKDREGRYVCRQCLEPAKAGDGAIPIADEALTQPQPASVQVCPSCGSSVPHGAAICVQCGLSLREGRKLNTDTSLPKPESAVPPRQGKCGKCGYSLQGLKEKRCPECGTPVGRLSDRERRARENAETVRWSYLKPAIQIAVGLGGLVIYHVASGHVPNLWKYGVAFAIELFFSELVYFACCFAWMGFDTHLHLVLLRVAGVCAQVGLIAALVGLAPVGAVVQGAVIVIAYIATLSSSMEIDFQDAVLVGIATYGVKLIMGLMIVAWLLAHL